MKKYKKIIIFGFSGSGKSTISNMIGKKLGLRIVHSSGILRDLYEDKKLDLSKTRYAKGFWETKKGVLFLKNRLKEKKPLDIVLDKILIRELNKNNIVVDCWSMPWLYKGGIKIYLETSLSVRSERVAWRGRINSGEARKMITAKDNDTVRLIKRLYNIDIKKETNVFDFVVNTNTLNKKEVADSIISFLEGK